MEIRIEMNKLQEQFQDAEAVCQALQTGEVDAVVVGRTDEEKRVLLLSGAYTRYRQLVEDMLQGAVTLSPSGEILFANHSFAAMVGAELMDLLRSPLVKHVAPPDRAKVTPLLEPRAGEPDVELALVRPDGTRAHVRASVVSASDDFVTLIITRLDSGDFEDAEATLDAIRQGKVDAFVIGGGKQVALLDGAQAPYRTLVERMRQGAVTVEPDGTIVYVNERFAAVIGLPHGRLIGHSLPQLIAEGDRHSFLSILSARDSAQGEVRLRCENGEHPTMLATMTSFDGHKLFLFSDVTERKRHEASEELTRKFLGMLAHEFRNMLAPISSSAQYLKVSQSNPEVVKTAEVILRQTERLQALVEDLRRINPKE